ncbi:MAG: DUF1016 domain-containing protein [Muribaculaceae bacterium]|nr:DUF1016 domain-containing protein [Muribaculaceae bacterium]
MNKHEIIKKGTALLDELRQIIEHGMRMAYASANQCIIQTYWNIGRRIVEEEQGGSHRAEYGKRLIQSIAAELSKQYGSNYTDRRLRDYRQFYLCFSDLEIWHTRVPNLTWSHFKRAMAVADPKARQWYVQQANNEMWSVRTLDRNISTQYCERMLACQRENLSIAPPEQTDNDPLEYIKNPYVAEFLGFKRDEKHSETELEQALIDNLQQFIMELGRGFAFVERQQHITTETADFYIDLVFYNFKIKSFVIFEIKTHPMTHQDVGQLDMYVRMYDDLVKDKTDNPTIGILLCTQTDKTIAKYSVLKDNDNLFAAKYMPYMPTEEELCREIENQKQFFLAQHGLKDEHAD